MALSFLERRKLQGTVDDKIAELEAEGLSFSARRAAQTALDDALEQLDVTIEPEPEAPPEVVAEPDIEAVQVNQRLDDLLAGKFNDLDSTAFIKIVGEIIEEIKDVDPVKPAVIAYIDIAKEKDIVAESALESLKALLEG